MISSVLLNGDNYYEWAKEMYNALREKSKTGFIEGTLKKPLADVHDFENWQTENFKIVGWIRSSIELKIKSTMTFTYEAHKLWLELKQRFLVGNKVRVHQIKAQLDTSILKNLDRSMVCTHCGQPGHEKWECWHVIGFPDWWVEQAEKQERTRPSGRGRGGRSSGSSNGGHSRGLATTAHATSSNSYNFPEVSPEQWKVLQQLFVTKTENKDELSGKKDLRDVILDTGASHHMTGNLFFCCKIL